MINKKGFPMRHDDLLKFWMVLISCILCFVMQAAQTEIENPQPIPNNLLYNDATCQSCRLLARIHKEPGLTKVIANNSQDDFVVMRGETSLVTLPDDNESEQ